MSACAPIRSPLWRALGITSANVMVILLVLERTRHASANLQSWLQAGATAFSVLFSGAYVALHLWTQWVRPLRKLVRLLPEIRRGEAPIDDLGAIAGGLAPLVPELRLTLQHLRQQKAEFARLEHETSQRVANRTNALERSLGALQQQAAKDALTGLLNRRMLDVHLPKLVDQCRAEGAPLALMMMDVDDFKLLNDTLGHGAGDDFLRSFGQLVRSTLRESDAAFRYGGDEFVIVLPHANLAQAQHLASRLASLVEGLTRTLRVDRPPRLSIGSLELASLPLQSPATALIHHADRLLYKIKQSRKVRRAG